MIIQKRLSSRPALDLTIEQENDILAGDNGDWDSEWVTHWCLGDLCPLKCGGSAVRAKKSTLACIGLSLCRSTVVPLDYRWKGMDQASAAAYRACKQHRLLPRALEGIFDAGKVRKADANVVLAAAIGEQPGEADKRLVKGGVVTRYFTTELNLQSVEGSLVANRPLQHFMNAAFATEAATTEYCELLHTTSGFVFYFMEALFLSIRLVL
jgi:hypothetical protein